MTTPFQFAAALDPSIKQACPPGMRWTPDRAVMSPGAAAVARAGGVAARKAPRGQGRRQNPTTAVAVANNRYDEVRYGGLLRSKAPVTGFPVLPSARPAVASGYPAIRMNVPTVADRKAGMARWRLAGLAGLSAGQDSVTLMRQGIDAIRAAADQADKYVAAMAFWTDSSVKAAAKENARQTRKGITVMTEKLGRLTAGGRVPTDAEVKDFLSSVQVFADVRALREAAELNNTANMVAEVAKKTAEDAAKIPAKVAGYSAAYLLGAAAVVALGALMLRKGGVSVDTKYLKIKGDEQSPFPSQQPA